MVVDETPIHLVTVIITEVYDGSSYTVRALDIATQYGDLDIIKSLLMWYKTR